LSWSPKWYSMITKKRKAACYVVFSTPTSHKRNIGRVVMLIKSVTEAQ
jgi:hypothetical protein